MSRASRSPNNGPAAISAALAPLHHGGMAISGVRTAGTGSGAVAGGSGAGRQLVAHPPSREALAQQEKLRARRAEFAHASSGGGGGGGGLSLALDGESYASSLVLDLRDQAYNDLHVLTSKFPAKGAHSVAYPWTIIVLSGNMLSRLDGLQRCTALRKLDLSRNGIDTLPKAAFWKQMRNLQVLLLHQNKIDSIHALQQLSCLPQLEILTVFGNAVEHHPAYRHVMVNVNPRLLLLDFFIVSDAELIEGANWGKDHKFATYARTLECDILNMHQAFDGSERSHLQVLDAQLEIVRKQHRKFSPVLKIQSLFRGVLVRRTIKVYHQAAAAIQNCWRRYRARKMVEQQQQGGLDDTGRGGVMFLDSRQQQQQQKRSGVPPAIAVSAHTIFLVHTSDVAVSLFMQLVRRVEQAEGVIAPDLIDANMLLLSPANIKDDYPLVKRIYTHRHSQPPAGGSRLLPGRHCPPRTRDSLQVLKPRCAGAVLNEHARFVLLTRIAQQTYAHRFLQFHSPGSRFHELLIRAVHAYNIEMGNYNEPGAAELPLPTLDGKTTDLEQRERHQRALQLGQVGSPGKARPAADANANKVIIYPGTTVNVIAAAVTIQSVYRAYRTRKHLEPSIGRRVAVNRAVTCLVRWWRTCLFKLRMHLLTGLKRYGDSINSRHLFCRGDILFLLRSSPNAYVDKEFNPEHRTIFGVEPKGQATPGARTQTTIGAHPMSASSKAVSGVHPSPSSLASSPGVDLDPLAPHHLGDPLGSLTLVVDQRTGKRFYPFPRWLANHWNHHPLPVVHGFTDTGIRVDLSSRMTELIKEGVQISILPDVSQPAGLVDADLASASAGEGWTASNFIKLSFASVEEARNRALTLAINTWLPSFHLLRPNHLSKHGPFTSTTPARFLAGAEMAFLMTPQHMTLCLQYQQAGGPSGPPGERHILYTTFWTPKAKTAPVSLYSNQAYLELQDQLKLVEEAHLAAEQLELRRHGKGATLPSERGTSASGARTTDASYSPSSSSADVDLSILGDDAVSSYQPSIFALKRDAAEAERLMSRRMVAQARVKLHTEKLVCQEHAREQTVMHRIKMEHLAEREIAARRQRQLDYERMDAVARAARDRLLALKHQRVHAWKHESAQRSKLRSLDRQSDLADLRRRVTQEKTHTQKLLNERDVVDADKVQEKIAVKTTDAQRHRRLAEEKDNTLAFISQQNMISRQLTVGMRNRLKAHQQEKTVATVQARREVAHQRRHEVHQILFENFNRRRQTALAQQLEIRNHVQMRAVKDENKVHLMRARRQHMTSVRALASSAAISTLNGNVLSTQAELHAALAQASPHFTPFHQQHPTTGHTGNLRPTSSPSAAYLPNSSMRTAVGGGPMHYPTSSATPGSFPPIRARTPISAGQPTAAPAHGLQSSMIAGDQLSLQMSALRDLAEKVKLQYQTSAANQRYQPHQPTQ